MSAEHAFEFVASALVTHDVEDLSFLQRGAEESLLCVPCRFAGGDADEPAENRP